MTATLEPVRLVIWDLDETFWRGTLSEGGITEYLQDHHDLVITLARRGIMSSICSKNDHATIEALLRARGLWDYFIFPSIDWTPKGKRIADLIEAVQLRPATVRFIDDNPNNLAEARSYVPELQTADELSIAAISDDPLFSGKDDRELGRLKQYKVLEQRKRDENQAASAGNNEEFLRSCGITVTIEHDLAPHMDRVIELVNRTNQLNFTKKRLEGEDAAKMLLEDVSEFVKQAGLIRVKDRYGDYGFAGFYVKYGLEYESELQHYCFSCRILGMGVEAWVYQKLGSPRLKIVGETLSNPITAPPVDWINVGTGTADNEADTKVRQLPPIRLVGGCDLDAVAHYLRFDTDDLVSQTNRNRGGLFFRQDSSALTVLKDGADDRKAVVKRLGYEDTDLANVLTADTPPGSLLIASFFGDFRNPTFTHRDTGIQAELAIQFFPWDLTSVTDETLEEKLEKNKARLATDLIRNVVIELRNHWTFKWELDIETAVRNTTHVFDTLRQDCHLILLLPSTRGTDAGVFKPIPEAEKYCQAIGDLAARYPKVSLVGFDECILVPSDIQNPWGGHFDRQVYARMAQSIVRCAQGLPVSEQRVETAAEAKPELQPAG